MTKVLITGATGNVGVDVIKFLQSIQHYKSQKFNIPHSNYVTFPELVQWMYE